MFASWTGRIQSAGRAAVVGGLVLLGAGCSKDSPTQPHPAPAKVSSITFSSGRDGNDEIYAMNADGTGQTNLAQNAASDQIPHWSRDGSKIAFESDRDDGSTSEIYVMNADGTGQTRLTTNSANDYAPVWSPDGSKIAFVSHRDGNDEIYVMNADGTGQVRLTNNATYDSAPTWSPDGTKIAYHTSSQDRLSHLLPDLRHERDGWHREGTSDEQFHGVGVLRPCLVAGREQDRLREQPRWQLRDLRDECRWHRTDSRDEQLRVRL